MSMTGIDREQVAELREYIAGRKVIADAFKRLTDDEVLELSAALGRTSYASDEGRALHTMLVREASTRQAAARRRHPTAHTERT